MTAKPDFYRNDEGFLILNVNSSAEFVAFKDSLFYAPSQGGIDSGAYTPLYLSEVVPPVKEPKGLGAVVMASTRQTATGVEVERETWLRKHDGDWENDCYWERSWDKLIDPEILDEGLVLGEAK